MEKFFKLVAVCVSALFVMSGTVFAETVDVSVPITIGATIGSVATLTVTPRNIVGDAVAAGLSFTNPTANPWTVSDQYLQVQYNCNLPLWAVRIVTDNKAEFPTMVGKPIGAGADGSWGTADDLLSYAGLVDTNSVNNPENRATLVWQVYANPQAPSALSDATVTDTWNAPWAYIADVSNSGYDSEIDSDSNINTLAYSTIAQGGAAGNGLNFHPSLGDGVPKPGDGDIAVYIGAKFAGLSAGSYSAKLMVQLIHE